MRPSFHARAPATVLGLVLFCLLCLGCEPRVQFAPGEECDLNSDCPEELVCRLGRCRVECRVNRDCGAGVMCLTDSDGLRGCGLPEDQECTLSSDCTDARLVCHFQTCTNPCDDDRDCPAGAECVTDEAGRGCRDVSTEQCTLNSDCAAPFVCAVDGVCREECRGDRDCRDGKVCLSTSPRICGFADGGPVDGGPLDGGPADSGPFDAGPDAGPGVVSPPPAPLLAAGLAHSCAAPSPGDLRCWGSNTDGQLGSGSASPVSGASPVTDLTSVSHVAVGARHSCAIDAGTVYCWGRNTDGQVGVAGVQTRPVAVSLPDPATDISCGNAHTCALAAGSVYCWGLNSDGQLGQPIGTTMSVAPILVSGLSGTPVEVSAFSNHSCVRFDDGTVDCFGTNDFGQIGVAGPSDVFAPSPVAGLTGVVQIQVGSTHTCALTREGEVLCWGLNTSGQLGSEGAGGPTPTTTLGPTDPVLELGLGSTHTCARTSTEVYCWGANTSRQSGHDGMATSTALAHADLGAVESVRAGVSHTCVWVSGTDLRCFGSNSFDQLNGEAGPGFSRTPLVVTW
ncbi:MAG: RCC1 domain-containing protein [Sandaracinaceae bacterium]